MFKVGDLVKIKKEILKTSSLYIKKAPVCIIIKEKKFPCHSYTLYNIYTRKTYSFRGVYLACFYVRITKEEF